MTTRSGKAKGRRLQQVTAKLISDMLGIPLDSIRVAMMSQSGPDVVVPVTDPLLRRLVIECANHERINVWKKLAQLKQYTTSANDVGLLVIARNRTQPYVMLPLRELLSLLACAIRMHRNQKPPGGAA